jgi:F-type H+-transporting ATPase subunit b
MLIDWFTVGAQALNFVILVWLLKRFLYKPVLDAIDAREQRIAEQLAEAARTMAEAQKERDDFGRQRAAIEQQRAALLDKARDDADAERKRLLDEARRAADALSDKRREALRNDIRVLSGSIRTRAQHEVLAIARKTLGDLASAELEDRMIAAFVPRLRELSASAKEEFAAALKSSSTPPRLRSAFELQPAQRRAIEAAVKETFSVDVPLRFETAAELVCGVELATEGQTVSWSITDYLSTLEASLGRIVDSQNPASRPATANGRRP